MDSKQYTYRVTWLAEENEYVGLCAEFPSLSWLDAEQPKAFSGIVDLVSDVVADMISNNEKLPVPLSEKSIADGLLFVFHQ
ncbi:antitoxin HicB [Acinetobacter bohemicus]|uniref:antitoxin HicB n=1 Tax=Acinetobacter sp. S4397-1 TaxID=2972915 RepID=UPI00209A8CB8|nr:antitoxin HicB [Acinetobacter sp. S4397-1]MCO8046391.1 antitoxin HicB [Acinetobacter sp. S4397-1]